MMSAVDAAERAALLTRSRDRDDGEDVVEGVGRRPTTTRRLALGLGLALGACAMTIGIMGGRSAADGGGVTAAMGRPRRAGGARRTAANATAEATANATVNAVNATAEATVNATVNAVNASAATGDAKPTRWVVVTSINAPTSDMRTMCGVAANDPTLGMVVVADTKTPTDWSAEGCDFLSVEAQKKMGSKLAAALPYKSYARKNLGYLYAISKGAEMIYETDDDNLSDFTKVFTPERVQDEVCSARLVEDKDHAAQNVYAYFGRPDIWPRGFPLNEINNTGGNVLMEKAVQKHYSPIKSLLVNGDPDTDAIFRLTRGEAIGKVQLDGDVPPVALDHGVICPFNSQAVLWSKEAFFLMLIPATTPMRVCDIWRGYFSQRLLWDMGGRLLFDQADVVQVRTAHDYLEDFEGELELYADAGRMVKALLEWKPKGDNMADRFVDLCRTLQDGKFWTETKYCEAWVEDLRTMGYEFPKVDAGSELVARLGAETCPAVAQLGFEEHVRTLQEKLGEKAPRYDNSTSNSTDDENSAPASPRKHRGHH